METSPALGQVQDSARILFTNATDGVYAEFLAGIDLEQGNVAEADSYLAQARPKMEVARAERDRLVKMLEVLGKIPRSGPVFTRSSARIPAGGSRDGDGVVLSRPGHGGLRFPMP